MSDNQFSLMYGKIPTKSFVARDYIVDDIFNIFNSDSPSIMTFAITGVKGSGKTVLLRSIVNKFSEKKNWLTVDLNFKSNLVVSLADKLLHA